MVTLALIQAVATPSSSSSRASSASSSIPSCATMIPKAERLGHWLYARQHDLPGGSRRTRQHHRRLVPASANSAPMQNALRRPGNLHTEPLPQNMAASGIAGGKNGFIALFATHPPLEQHIAALNRN